MHLSFLNLSGCHAPGRGMVSFHAYHGPVKFLTMATAVCNVSQATMATLTSNTPSQCQPGAQEVEGTQRDENCSGLGHSSASSHSHASVLQDSLSSSCGSLALSQGSLEHGPEDGAIYDLLNEPAHFQKSKQTERVNVSSLLVVSGGLGHRRINRKTKPSKHEEMVSTVMVWQIPLPNLWGRKMEVYWERWGSGFSLDAAAQTPVSMNLFFLLLVSSCFYCVSSFQGIAKESSSIDWPCSQSWADREKKIHEWREKDCVPGMGWTTKYSVRHQRNVFYHLAYCLN